MIDPSTFYDEACHAGDPVAWIGHATDDELRKLQRYAAARVAANTVKGGVPALIKLTCTLEAAKRFLNPDKS